MNTFLFRQLPSLLLGLTVSFCLSAQPGQYPGSLNFDSIPQISGREPDVEVTLYGPVLKLVAQLPVQYMGGDENTAEMLRVIDQVLVRVYSGLPTGSQTILDQMAATSNALVAQDWMRVVRVREQNNSSVDILLKMADDGENINGIVVMALDGQGQDSELVFVNIAGNFNPAYLSNLAEQFDIDVLESVQLP